MLTPIYSPATGQRKIHALFEPWLYKSSLPHQVGTHTVLRGQPAVAPFAWQSNKAMLFYFTKHSVSEI